MTDSPDPREQRRGETTITRGAARELRAPDPFDPLRAELPAELPPDPAYKREPLFSRKVLFGWAFATLAIWFAFSFIVPEIVTAIKTEIAASMAEGKPGTTVINTPNGQTITITRTKEGVTIDRKGPETPAPPVVIPVPTPPGAAAEPAAPALPPVPTEKK